MPPKTRASKADAIANDSFRERDNTQNDRSDVKPRLDGSSGADQHAARFQTTRTGRPQ
ncbi:hypothetical protein NK6_9695 [Bradyrhizobium diazoefficiens]|uniref:Uncharacterized protein n=1 Tax=Bradyrhizobium diazoefficiens TaxID=1355477 RepID=A0A0E4FZ93_9BRAD|nr:hypothetical protein NK6_9695 [Bradyrhizobium diazoefficiens]